MITFALLPSILFRHRLPHLPRCPVLWTLLHHGCAHYSQWQRLPPRAGRNLLLLALLGSLDSATPDRLEPLWARRSRHHLLSGLEDPVHKQCLLHHLPFYLLPVPAILHYSLLLWQVAVHHQTGEILLMPLHHTTYECVWDKTLHRHWFYLLFNSRSALPLQWSEVSFSTESMDVQFVAWRRCKRKEYEMADGIMHPPFRFDIWLKAVN